MRIHVPRWTVPSDLSSGITLRTGNSVPLFESTKFGNRFADNLVEWFKRSPRRLRGTPPPMLEANWRATRRAFWQSQALSLSLYSIAVILMLSLHFGRPRKEPEMTIVRATPVAIDMGNYWRKLPSGKDLAGGGGGGGKHSKSPVTEGMAPKFMRFQIAPPSLPRNETSRLVAAASLLGPPDLQFPSPNLDRFGDPLAGLVSDSEGRGGGGGMGDGSGTGDGNGNGPGLG